MVSCAALPPAYPAEPPKLGIENAVGVLRFDQVSVPLKVPNTFGLFDRGQVEVVGLMADAVHTL